MIVEEKPIIFKLGSELFRLKIIGRNGFFFEKKIGKKSFKLQGRCLI